MRHTREATFGVPGRGGKGHQGHRLNCQVPAAAEQAVSPALRYMAARRFPSRHLLRSLGELDADLDRGQVGERAG